MLSPSDEIELSRLVPRSAFTRGKLYAHRGAVTSCQWEEGGSRVVGMVQGTARQPYAASVHLTRTASARLARLEAVCTCPVGVNCKHAVALLLASAAPAVAARRPDLTVVGTPKAPRARPPRAARWEEPLRALVGAGRRVGDEPDRAEVGLQFELVLDRLAPGGRTRTRGPGIRVRPVVPSHSGNWVRTGVSWDRLDYLGFGRSTTDVAIERIGLLKELLALSRLAGSRSSFYYSSYSSSSSDAAVWLEAIESRRLWDLLQNAEGLDLPLLRCGRQPLPIDLHRSPVEPVIDVSRTGPDLALRALVRVDGGGGEVPLDSSLMIGSSPHGIAWWDEPPAPSVTPVLHLAPLSRPLDRGLREMLGRDPVRVPRRDEARFVRDFYPALRRRVAVRCDDGSMVLPDVPEPTLVLSVRHLAGHRSELAWSGVRGDRAVDDAVAAAIPIAGAIPGLVDVTAFGARLTPTARLDGMDAARFVTDVLPALAALPGVVVEQQGNPPDYREATATPVVSLNGSASASGDWFDLSVEVTVGGEAVPFADLFVALAEGRPHLLLPSGTFFKLDRPELRQLAALITEARSLNDTTGDTVRVSRFQASLWEDLQRLGVVTAQAEAWEKSVRALAESTGQIDRPAPAGLQATLRPYQHVGFNWLAFLHEHRLGGILADDMGLGKTLQALALICHVRDQADRPTPFLVVAPTSVVGNWVAECQKFAPELNTATVGATESRRGTRLADLAEKADVVVTSYALFRLEFDDYNAIEWAGLFLDEAQFVKNPASRAYQRARMLKARFKVAMTGTPMENTVMELWSLLSITAPGLFARPERFAEYYRIPIERQGDTDRLDQLRRRIRPLMLRRTKEQVASDLPDKQEQVLELPLEARHQRLYQTYLQRERQKVLGLLGDLSKNRFEIFRSLTLLRQASLDVSLVDPKKTGIPSAKLDTLMEMLHDVVADGHRVLVFSQFTRFLALARARVEAAGIRHCYLDGRTRNRPAVIDEFRSGAAPVFLVSLKAGGFGLNLTEADYCILLDPWWNPATEAQAVDRVHRIGQTRKVMVYRLVSEGTIEDKVMALKARKAALFASIMDAGGFETAALSATDIRGLLD